MPSHPAMGGRKTKPTGLRAALCLTLFLGAAVLFSSPLRAETVCIIIHGLGGLPEYEENFVKWSEGLEKAFQERAAAKVHRLDGRSLRRDDILATFREVTASLQPDSEVWLFLVGHANVNLSQYKFNIKGPDLTGDDLEEFLNGLGESRAYLVVATSSSGGLAEHLGAPKRVVVTATRSAFERYPPLFLSFLLESIESAEADTNKDGKISLLESYLFSRNKVAQWFADKGRIQVEHPLLDDQAKVRLGEKKKGDQDQQPEPSGAGLLAAAAYLSTPPEKAYRTLQTRELAQRRTGLEREIESLKFQKAELPQVEYYKKLEVLLIRLAQLNERISELEGEQ
ncbi:MAG: hypothetical protein V3T83_17660 [Acidobacteriota bacterium]